MKLITLLPAASALLAGVMLQSCRPSVSEENLKPRLVVMTDIGDCAVEPDDMESAVRLMAYADMVEIEAVMTTVGWNCDPYPQGWESYLAQVVDAYGEDVHNLMKRSGQTEFLPLESEDLKQQIGYWPSADYIRSRCMAGSHRAGIGVIGEGNDSPGSEFLIRLADEDDPRPIWVAAWGSGNTLAQAVWKVRQTRSEEEFKAFLAKFRIYTITDQDMVYAMRMNRAYSSHQWLRKEFSEDLKFIWDEGTWQLQCELGKRHWARHQELIQGHGALGKVYPNYLWGVEGDTPSFLYILPNGLSDPEDPRQAGWAGYHRKGICPDSLTTAWTSWQEPERSITEGYKLRFYPDELNDFCARIQWAEEGRGNTNPEVYINGKRAFKPLTLKAKAGSTLKVDASGSRDRENDSLSFKWWIQEEISCAGWELLPSAEAAAVSLRIPADAAGSSIHLVCEVHDDAPLSLAGYARVIIECEK